MHNTTATANTVAAVYVEAVMLSEQLDQPAGSIAAWFIDAHLVAELPRHLVRFNHKGGGIRINRNTTEWLQCSHPGECITAALKATRPDIRVISPF